MSNEAQLPRRPAEDPEVLAKQLEHALRELRSKGQAYQGYVAQLIRTMLLSVHDGDLESPKVGLDALTQVFHLAEQLGTAPEAVEAAAWLRATARFLEIAKDVLAPRLTIDTFLQRERPETEREILEILLRAEKQPLRRGEIADRWSSAQPAPTHVRIGQILADLHEDGILVRVKQPARGGSDVSFYRLSRLGRELCERLELKASPREPFVKKPEFYARLRKAMQADTTEPLLLTTYTDIDNHPTVQRFHEDFLAELPRIKRPVKWIFDKSKYLDEKFRPTLERTPGKVDVFVRPKKVDLGPTVQAFGDGGCLYPIVDDIALVTDQQLALQTWNKQRESALQA